MATLQQSLSPRSGSERLLQEIAAASITSTLGSVHVGIISEVRQTTQHCNRNQEQKIFWQYVCKDYMRELSIKLSSIIALLARLNDILVSFAINDPANTQMLSIIAVDCRTLKGSNDLVSLKTRF